MGHEMGGLRGVSAAARACRTFHDRRGWTQRPRVGPRLSLGITVSVAGDSPPSDPPCFGKEAGNPVAAPAPPPPPVLAWTPTEAVPRETCFTL